METSEVSQSQHHQEPLAQGYFNSPQRKPTMDLRMASGYSMYHWAVNANTEHMLYKALRSSTTGL